MPIKDIMAIVGISGYISFHVKDLGK